MTARIDQFKALAPDKMVSVKSHEVDPVTSNATLVYTYADRGFLKFAMIRWIANGDGLCILEIGVTGLPQDKPALTEILDHAADSATRTDLPG